MTIRVERRQEGIVAVTLDRPRSLNALTAQMVSDLHDCFRRISVTDDRIVILTGAGRGFCAGLDLKEAVLPETADEAAATQKHIASLVRVIRSLPQPVIAGVNGPAVGGGLGIALACDIRVASSSATFAANFINVGLSGCDIGVSWLLPRIAGAALGFEMMLTGRTLGAAEALDRGIVSRVVPDDELSDVVSEVATQLATRTPLALSMTKEVMWAQLEIPSIDAGIALEDRTQALLVVGGGLRAAASAFRERS